MEQYTISLPQPERQRPDSTPQLLNVNASPFTNIRDIEEDKGNLPRTITQSDKEKVGVIPLAVTAILGSVYLIVTLCVLITVPILQLAIGIAYRDQCQINSNIPVYLIVTGACGIASIALTLMIAVSFICCIKQNSVAASVAIGCTVAFILILVFLMSIFLFVWFIVGSVWVFSAKNTVDFDHPLSSNYCRRTLYQFAFWILIVTYIMMGVSCCFSCFRRCFQFAQASKK